MKKIIVTLSLTFTFGWVNAQTKPVQATEMPATIKESFSKKYPNVKPEQIEKAGEGYQVKFNQNNRTSFARFDREGNFLELEQQLENGDLPHSVWVYLRKNVQNIKMEELHKKIDSKGIQQYEVKANGKVYTFDGNGNYIENAK